MSNKVLTAEDILNESDSDSGSDSSQDFKPVAQVTKKPSIMPNKAPVTPQK